MNKVTRFLKEVQAELKKVAWPNRNETMSSTTIVIVSVLILTVFIGILDFIFSRVINLLIR